MAVLPKVRSALCAASQLPGKRSTDVEDSPAPALYSKPNDDDSSHDFFSFYFRFQEKGVRDQEWPVLDEDYEVEVPVLVSNL